MDALPGTPVAWNGKLAQIPALCFEAQEKRSWFHSRSTAAWVEFRLAPLRAQLQNQSPRLQGYSSARYLTPGEDLQRLCEEGQLERALDILLRMDEQGVVPPKNVYKALLKACTKGKALAQAKRLHAQLAKHRLQSTVPFGEAVVSMFVKCGGLEDALVVFDKLRSRTVFSWTAVISGYSNSGQGQQALRMYRLMQEQRVRPNTYTFVSLLKACASMGDLKEGKRIHAEAAKFGCEADLFVSTCLLDMYAKCGSIIEAQNVFDKLSQRNVVSWTAILAAYVEHGQAEEVLELYKQMRMEEVTPNDRTFVSVIQACGMLAEKEEDAFVDGQSMKSESLQQGKTIHADAWRNGYESDVFLASTLVSMYAKCGSIVDAKIVFGVPCDRDVVLWTAMIAAYVQQGQGNKALQLYSLMQEEGVHPNVWTYLVSIHACGMLAEGEEHVDLDGQSIKLKSLAKGKAMHEKALMKGYFPEVEIGNSLVSMYGRCGSIVDAQNLFDGLSQRDVVSWNAMLAAYIQQGQADNGLLQYKEMLAEGMSPDTRTFVNTLQACGMLAEEEEEDTLDGWLLKVSSLEKGKAIQAEAWMKGYKSEVFIGSSLITIYGKCGSLEDAQLVFYGLSQRTVVPWNAMLSAYVEHGHGEKALMLYRQMQEGSVYPNEITLMCTLQACGDTGCLHICREIHQMLVALGNDLSTIIGNTLIHAYGRCAQMVDAQNVFNAMAKPNVVSWNALIAGYAREGNCGATLQCYAAMLLAGMKPNGVTFLSLLSLCSHVGLVDSGILYFESMSKNHGITPDIAHYSTMVDLLGRAGYLTSIKDLFSTMPIQPTLPMWLSLLNCCRKHGEVVLGKEVFDCVVRLWPRHAGAYVLMSNTYADAGFVESAMALNDSRLRAGARKKPGQSWISHEQEVNYFVVGHSKHPQQEEVNEMLGKVSKWLNEKERVPQSHHVVGDSGELDKVKSLCSYSENIAETIEPLNTESQFVRLKNCAPG